MNSVAIKHLVWKEARQISAILIAMGIVAAILIVMSSTRLFDTHSSSVFQSSHWIWTACMILCSLVGMTIGISIFSMEKEQGTAGLLGNFPIRGSSIVVGKFLFGLLATLLFATIVLLSLTFFCWRENAFVRELSQQTLAFKVYFLFASVVLPGVELFAWGAFFATLTNRTLLSAILAALTNSVLIYMTQDSSLVTSEAWVDGFQSPYINAFGLRLFIVAIVLIADWFLANRWCNQPTRALASPKLLERRGTRGGAVRIPFFKLLWQTLHQAKWTILASTIAISAAGFILVNTQMPNYVDRQHDTVLLVAPPLFCFIGLCVFWSDQRQQNFLFFQQHAEYGRWVWSSRLLVGLTMFTIAFSAFSICSYIGANSIFMSVGDWTYQNPFRQHDSILLIHNIVPLFTVCFGCFAVGQLFSILFRSLILGPLFAVVSAYLFAFWAMFLFPLYVGYWWTVLPLGLSMLVATFLYAPKWISQTKHLSSAMKSCGIVATTFVLTGVGILVYRAYEIPEIAAPLLLPTEIKNLEPDDYPAIWPNKYPKLAKQWESTSHHTIVFEDDLAQARADQDRLIKALNSADFQAFMSTPAEPKSEQEKTPSSISEVDLKPFVEANREFIDTLMSIKGPYGVMPTLQTSKQSHLRWKLRELLFAYARSLLLDGKLTESFDALAQYVALTQVIHYRVEVAELSMAGSLWDEWLDHPDHTAATLRYGQLVLPEFLGPSERLTYFDIKQQTNERLAYPTKLRASLPLPTEVTRYRRLNEYYALKNTREHALISDLYQRTGHMQWFSRNNFLMPEGSGSVPEKWDEPLATFGAGSVSGAMYLPLLHVKHELLLHKAEQGEYPPIESFNTIYKYRPEGLNGDLYVWDGFEQKLLVKKGQPFLLANFGQLSRKETWSAPFERWKGVPDPESQSTFQIELLDGTVYESEGKPTRSGHWDGSYLPTSTPVHTFNLLSNNLPVQVPIDDVKSVTPMREIGEGETTYLLKYNFDFLELLLLKE